MSVFQTACNVVLSLDTCQYARKDQDSFSCKVCSLILWSDIQSHWLFFCFVWRCFFFFYCQAVLEHSWRFLRSSSVLFSNVKSINWDTASHLCPMKTNGYWLQLESRNLTLSRKRRAPWEGISLSPAPSSPRWMVIGAASNGSSIEGDVSAVVLSLLIACRQADQYAINHGEKAAR